MLTWGGPLPSVASRSIARQSWPRDRAAAPSLAASRPMRVTIVAAQPVARSLPGLNVSRSADQPMCCAAGPALRWRSLRGLVASRDRASADPLAMLPAQEALLARPVPGENSLAPPVLDRLRHSRFHHAVTRGGARLVVWGVVPLSRWRRSSYRHTVVLDRSAIAALAHRRPLRPSPPVVVRTMWQATPGRQPADGGSFTALRPPSRSQASLRACLRRPPATMSRTPAGDRPSPQQRKDQSHGYHRISHETRRRPLRGRA
jgi:hypothetical protein